MRGYLSYHPEFGDIMLESESGHIRYIPNYHAMAESYGIQTWQLDLAKANPGMAVRVRINPAALSGDN
jgi:hypothetical protein